ncbi:MAG: hypothetical protein EXR99_07195 [Gemmataceae bacterium]|nr:hypothetical protein [Gemmataceae bacterium]
MKLKQAKNPQGNPSNSARSSPAFSVGVIRADELYTLSEFKRRLEFTNATLRSARRAGLRVYYAHKRGFVLGRDWIDYVIKSAGHPDGERRCGHA